MNNKDLQSLKSGIDENENIIIETEDIVTETINMSDMVRSPRAKGIIEERKKFEAFDEDSKAQIRKKAIAKLQRKYEETLSNNPEKEQQYIQEIPILLQRVAKIQSVKGLIFNPSFRIMQGIMAVSFYRAKNENKGLIRTTDTVAVEARIENLICYSFTQEELCMITDAVDNGEELTPAQTEIIMLLLNVAPKVHTHPLKPFLD
ncbi:MAG: hypothetical protein J6Q94_09975 [Clostridia bacterium]|nr:hypothetical protein [Clostridia bacterium]